MQLSDRLLAVADMVTPGNRLVDAGCDHGYLPIYLIQQKKIPSAIAMDVRPGPLSRAKQHIQENGLKAYIETRLSDGAEALHQGEGDTLVIAGMGGRILQKILREGETVLADVSEFILQPQSEIRQVRVFLCDHGYKIIQEDMILEDGKYYPVIKAIHGFVRHEKEIFYRYGKLLLEQRNEVLYKFLKKELQSCENIKQQLLENPTVQTKKRLGEIKKELRYLEEALNYYEM